MEAGPFLASFERMLEQVFPLTAVREIEQGGAWQAQWGELERSGYLDALVPESAGGAGLALGDLAPLLIALGRHAIPLPAGETMVARALLVASDIAVPAGPIALASGGLVVPFARVAAAVLYDDGEALKLIESRHLEIEPTCVTHDLAARIAAPEGLGRRAGDRPAGGLRPIAALLRAAGIAGAAERVLAMTVAHAGERVQFGKAIGSRQAIQQQIAVMAEQAVAAQLAVEMACASGFPPALLAAAAAKSVASVAAVQVATIAHAVHGAIGISAEHDLQLFTRALHAWRLAEGAESYWNRIVGAAALQSQSDSVEWVRRTLFGVV